MQRDHRSISELAYHLWEARGRPEGTAERDWHDAERQLSASAVDTAKTADEAAIDEALKDSFPASDAAASQLPDVPPVNADAKWEAAGVVRKGPNRRSGTSRRKAPSMSPKDRGSSPDR